MFNEIPAAVDEMVLDVLRHVDDAFVVVIYL